MQKFIHVIAHAAISVGYVAHASHVVDGSTAMWAIAAVYAGLAICQLVERR